MIMPQPLNAEELEQLARKCDELARIAELRFSRSTDRSGGAGKLRFINTADTYRSMAVTCREVLRLRERNEELEAALDGAE